MWTWGPRLKYLFVGPFVGVFVLFLFWSGLFILFLFLLCWFCFCKWLCACVFVSVFCWFVCFLGLIVLNDCLLLCFLVSFLPLFLLFPLLFYLYNFPSVPPKIIRKISQDAPPNRLHGWFGVDLCLLQGERTSVVKRILESWWFKTIWSYTPEVKHGTWKLAPGKGDSYWKTSFSGSMLNLGRVSRHYCWWKSRNPGSTHQLREVGSWNPTNLQGFGTSMVSHYLWTINDVSRSYLDSRTLRGSVHRTGSFFSFTVPKSIGNM